MINLLPADVKNDIQYGKYNVRLVRYTILVLILGVSLVATLLFGINIVNREEASLKDSIQEKQTVLTEASSVVAEAKELENTITTIEKLLAREVSFSEMLVKIGSVMPTGASLGSLALTGDPAQPLQLQVSLSNQELAAVLRETLEASDIFANADLQSVTGNYDEDGNAVDFQAVITVTFEEPQS